MMVRTRDDASVYTVTDGGSSDFAPSASPPSTRNKKRRTVSRASTTGKRKAVGSLDDIEDTGDYLSRLHGEEYHDVIDVVARQSDLLNWFEGVREKRGMPWRKRYDDELSEEEKGQRAYEIWVSEVMLQQTQVSTVIAYWQRWVEKWPTIADLAKADLEEVNAAWRGLGYYRRAKSLLSAAKHVMHDPRYKGRLPNDPGILEKEIDGVGRYTAGAISSMAYGARAPLVDGNVHRVLSRLLALHAPQTAPSTIKLLWQAAEGLVHALPNVKDKKGVAGDWNQALMELGSQICKPANPECSKCPVRPACRAHTELSISPPWVVSTPCFLCAPVPVCANTDRIPAVTVFPMRKEKKASRDEEEVVYLTEWRGEEGDRRWLFVKRPDKGLLAGLFEPPTTPIQALSTVDERYETCLSTLASLLDLPLETLTEQVASHRDVGTVPHIFSHINMTYNVVHIVLTSSAPAPFSSAGSSKSAVWLEDGGVEHANVGTGVKKVWAEAFGAWGKFEHGAKRAKSRKSKKFECKPEVKDGKVLKRIVMPAMPVRKAGV